MATKEGGTSTREKSADFGNVEEAKYNALSWKVRKKHPLYKFYSGCNRERPDNKAVGLLERIRKESLLGTTVQFTH